MSDEDREVLERGARALKLVITSIKDLPPEERVRVLAAVVVFFLGSRAADSFTPQG